MKQNNIERLSADILAKTKKINFKDCKNIRIWDFLAFQNLMILSKEEKTSEVRTADYLDNKNEYENALITGIIVPKDLKLVSKRYANTAQSHAVLTMSAAMKKDGIHMAGAVKNVGILHFCDLEKTFNDDPDISEEAIIRMVSPADTPSSSISLAARVSTYF